MVRALPSLMLMFVWVACTSPGTTTSITPAQTPAKMAKPAEALPARTFQTQAPKHLPHDLAIPAKTLVKDITAGYAALLATLPPSADRTRVFYEFSAEGAAFQAFFHNDTMARLTGRTSGESYDLDVEAWIHKGRIRYAKLIHRHDPTKFMDSEDDGYKQARALRSTTTRELYFQGDQLRALRVDGALVPSLTDRSYPLREHMRDVHDISALMQLPDKLFDAEGYEPWLCTRRETEDGRCLELRSEPTPDK